MKVILSVAALCLLVVCRNKITHGQDQVAAVDTVQYGKPADLKPQMAGFAVRDFESLDTTAADTGLLRIVNSFIVKLNWSDVQPNEMGEIKHPNALDNALAYAKRMNAAYPGMHLNLKLRLYCGIYTPEWVKKKTGSVSFYKSGDVFDQMANFWEPAFMTAFADVQQKLAAVYDTVPEITEVVDGATGTASAEALIRNVGNRGSQKKNAVAMLGGGYTTEKDIAAIKKSVDIMKAWKKTRVSMAFSAFDIIKPGQQISQDMTVTKSVMDYFVGSFGQQAVLGNNGLRDDEKGTNASKWAEGGQINQVYKWLKEYHTTKNIGVYFQTATVDRIGDIKAAIESGIANGAGMIELPGGARSLLKNMKIEDLRKYDAQLEAQAKK